jgi:hypothetical protein
VPAAGDGVDRLAGLDVENGDHAERQLDHDSWKADPDFGP